MKMQGYIVKFREKEVISLCKMASKDNNKKSPQPSKTNKKQPRKLEAKAPVEPSNRDRGLMIVGIGASAGGLTALRSFFNALPVDTDMAFVVITHLHPEHESHMAELLQKNTQMPTQQVTKKIKIEPNQVYVIPPNRSIIMTDTHLDTREFDEPHGHRTPIDHFFRSMAASGHSDPVAIILSGGGTDGSVGIKDVKEVGGLIMVQHPEDAEYDSMPRAALTTGLVDVVLPAAQLAQKLTDYIQHRPQLPHDPGELSEMESETLNRILAQVHARTGHDFTQYKRSTILRRVERRMQLNGFETLDAYLAFLRGSSDEVQAMFNDILIGVTNFFRDRASWEALKEKVIPQLFEGKQGQIAEKEGIRIWSIGCATGEEAYGLAMLLLEESERQDFHTNLQIFASDLDEKSIAQARDGLYPAAIEADVSSERLERFFDREGEYYRVKRELREIVLFTSHNVMRDPPFSRQDLIACRNMLIYLERAVQDRVFDIFHYSLNLGGYLFLGNSESAEHIPELFNIVDKTHRLYKAKPWMGEKPHVPSMPLSFMKSSRSYETFALSRPRMTRFLEQPEILEELHKKTLENYGPPSVIVNDKFAILHISETAGRYLHHPRGTITGDLLTLVRPELQLELRSALFHAFEKGKSTVSRLVAVQFNGHKRRVLVTVRPRLSEQGTGQTIEREALVVFIEDELENVDDSVEITTPHNEAEQDEMVSHLQSESQRLREQLQITMEEYESSNEEMKAANEELQSINEEYRSATEELETSKEELQSVNEELQTVNSEMRNKLDELSQAHQELENLMGATEIATLYLDRNLNIQRFTAGVQELFSIVPTDRGRRISDLAHKLGYEKFPEDAEQVLRSLVPLEREIEKGDGNWYVMRMRPYRTMEHHIEGVVVSFIDINKLKATEEELMEIRQTLEQRAEIRTVQLEDANKQIMQARDLFENLFEVNPVPTSITRLEDGTFINVNDAYLQYFSLDYEDVIGHTSRELNLPLDPTLRPRMIARVQKQGFVRNVEMETKLPSGEVRTILVSMQIVTVDNENALMLAFIDITEHIVAERQTRTAATSLSAAEQVERQRISQILHDELQQNIFAVKMQLSFLGEAVAKGNAEAAKVDLQQLDTWLADAIATTRQLSVDLSPPVLRGEGLTESLLWIASQMKTQYGLDVQVESNGVQATFQDDVRMVVFQSLRELLFNIVKHSGTLEAVVALEEEDGGVNILVSDEGKGFNMQEINELAANGLRKMRDRLFLIGGNLKIDSKPGHGTRVTIEAPTADSMV